MDEERRNAIAENVHVKLVHDRDPNQRWARRLRSQRCRLRQRAVAGLGALLLIYYMRAFALSPSSPRNGVTLSHGRVTDAQPLEAQRFSEGNFVRIEIQEPASIV